MRNKSSVLPETERYFAFRMLLSKKLRKNVNNLGKYESKHRECDVKDIWKQNDQQPDMTQNNRTAIGVYTGFLQKFLSFLLY